MLATAIIVFREVLEAALIVGIVLAAARGVPRRGWWVGLGVLGGVLAAAVVAGFANSLSALADGMGQELFNATILFAAVIMLGWHNVWMSRHGREMAAEMTSVGQAIVAGIRPLYALAFVVGIAVLREGAEVVLFLYGIAVTGNDGTLTLLFGGVVGLGIGVAVGTALYAGLLRIPAKHLFHATSVLILLLAAGMAAQGADFLAQAGYLPALGERLWDTSWVLTEKSIPGRVLHTLIGYVDRPAGIQLVFYGITIAVIGGLSRLLHHHPKADRSRALPAE
jgi:high-affinity iron transporter